MLVGGCEDARFNVATLAPDAATGVGFREEVEPVQVDASTPLTTRDPCIDLDGDGYGQGCVAGPDCNDDLFSAHPGANEQCGDGLDNDCDSRADEGCGCTEGESIECYPGPPGTAGVGRCRIGRRVCVDGVMGECVEARVPVEETCNGVDDNCDGVIDENVTNACGACGEVPVEVCDEADNDCDGSIDEQVRNACDRCGPTPIEYCDGIDNDCDGEADEDCRCIETVTQPCYSGPDGTRGVGACAVGQWVCHGGERIACAGEVTPLGEDCNGIDDDCDGETDEGLTNACGQCGVAPRESCNGIRGGWGNGLDDDCDMQVDENCLCDGRENQPCYGGPPHTLGKGICRGGFFDCVDGAWGDCVGDEIPRVFDECGDELDGDCDGKVDEGCVDVRCEPRDEVCDELDNDCDNMIDEGVRGPCGCILPGAVETCDNGFDDDCDGRIEESCECEKGPPISCYGGPPDTVGVGVCRAGLMQCAPGAIASQDGLYTECRGWVGPRVEECNALDDDCDGVVDENPSDGNACGYCGRLPNEECDSVDNDCDGEIDEGVKNACGGCGDIAPESCDGIDNDCDGFADEGLVNFCGECGISCFSRTFDDAEDWERGAGHGAVRLNLVPPPGQPDDLTLATTERAVDPVLWVSATNDETVVKINTRNCDIIDEYPTFGSHPSRTAVSLDGSLWVGNRGFRDADDVGTGNAVHLDPQGNLICRANVTGTGSAAVRAVTLDQNGDAWLGSWDKRTIYRVSGWEVEPGNAIDGMPTCRILQEVPLASNPYGAAVDSRGFLWTSGIGGDVTKIDTRDGTVVAVVPRNGYIQEGETRRALSPSWYGMAIDMRDNVWYGVWGSNEGLVARVDGKTHEVQYFSTQRAGQTRGMAVDFEGNIWAAGWGGRAIFKFSPDGELMHTIDVGDSIVGVAIDADGQVFGVSSNRAYRYSTSPPYRELCRTEGLPTLYTYSDMTGMQLLNITVRNGRWTVPVDGGHPDVRWDSLEWNGEIPEGATIEARVRTAPSQEELDRAAWSQRMFGVPAIVPDPNPVTGFTPYNRWIEIEASLSYQNDEVRPILTDLTVNWQRP